MQAQRNTRAIDTSGLFVLDLLLLDIGFSDQALLTTANLPQPFLPTL